MNWYWDCYGSRTYNGTWRSNMEDAERIVMPYLTKQQIKAKQAGTLKTYVSELTHRKQQYYGKARLVEVYSRNNLTIYLISYNTAVAKIDTNGHFIRLWDGYSATTQKHIDAFMNRFGMRGLCKADWLSLPIGKWGGTREVV